ncbi:MAG TPA: 2Fe-2S iron-sulfur cluster-binding protein [Steroidobacteraceae bacterium]|nr:2Fe-2S iron-sulfur cluster-binding protein [Steroidobacteraceae bacterium]
MEPGGHRIQVPPGQDVLTAALAAGIAIPYSCRAGRCASCKSRLVSGRIEYPPIFGDGAPPGITTAEIARGDVLLCQAQPVSDLSLEVRRVPVRASNAAMCELVAIEPLSIGALRVRLRYLDLTLSLRGGQFVDVRNHAGDAERLPVVGVSTGIVEVESPPDGSALHEWLARHAVPGAPLRISGPFDQPR